MEGASAMTGVVVTYPHMFFVSDFRIDFHGENPSSGLTRNPGTHRWSSCTHWSSCLRRPSTVQLLEAIIFGPSIGGVWGSKWTGKATEKIATAKAKRTYVKCVSWSFTCFFFIMFLIENCLQEHSCPLFCWLVVGISSSLTAETQWFHDFNFGFQKLLWTMNVLGPLLDHG